MESYNPTQPHRVAVLGASNKPNRYSNMAVSLLREYGHDVYPVHPIESEILGLAVYPSLDQLPSDLTIDTLTLYIGPNHIHQEIPRILTLKPNRVILNPGTESQELIDQLEAAGIPYLLGCTLVMLKTGQF
jgi:predicted CoA-binding protein